MLLDQAFADVGLSAPEAGVIPRSDTLRLADRDGWTCHYCLFPLGWGHASVRAPEVDHKQARARGGSDCLDNKVLACGPCNQEKGATHHDDFCQRCEKVF
jgi:5-methylcytosine-specific restriction endonuclease McrA